MEIAFNISPEFAETIVQNRARVAKNKNIRRKIQYIKNDIEHYNSLKSQHDLDDQKVFTLISKKLKEIEKLELELTLPV